jgi:streptogramin lyase
VSLITKNNNKGRNMGEPIREMGMGKIKTLFVFYTLLVSFFCSASSSDSTYYVVDRDAQAIFAIDPITGAQNIVSSGGLLISPRGITIDFDGDLLVTVQQGLIRVDPVTGVQTLISTGGFLDAPWGITTSSSGNIFVADPNFGGIISIDSITGVQTSVSLSGLLMDPTGITFDLREAIMFSIETTTYLNFLLRNEIRRSAFSRGDAHSNQLSLSERSGTDIANIVITACQR